ncbi:MAG: phosphoenolpyruvate kinase [Gemmatimonadaceae bacterium]
MPDARVPGVATSLSPKVLKTVAARLHATNVDLARRYPGDAGTRQPVHTVYGGAHLFTADTAHKLGRVALRALEEYAADSEQLASAVGLADEQLAAHVHGRVFDKLRAEPVEDFRIDFEDGYGVRPDAEEDGHAASVASEVARGMRDGALPAFIGIRIKPLTDELQARSLRTLDIFMTTLLARAGGLPKGWVLTLPKISHPDQVAAFADALDALESKLRLAEGTLRFEAMVETPQLVMDAEGRSALPALIDAARGRLIAAHFGTYDYTAALNITASHQRMRHPACDFARHVMQVAFAGTGVWLSDGSTTVMPVPVHRAAAGGTLSDAQQAENRSSVHRAWRLHYDDVRHSLATGFYQGWDLHPAQLVTRYAAIYAFFLEGVEAAGARLRNFLAKAAQATLVGDVFDDAATGQGLLNFFLRAINSGALSEAEAGAMIDLTPEELRTRSFTRILKGRQGR